jgi:hypothetical protein
MSCKCNYCIEEEEKELLRASLRILRDPSASTVPSLQETVLEVGLAIENGLDDDGGIFYTQNDFKEEIFSAQVVSDIMTAVKATKGDNGDYSPEFCTKVAWTLYTLIKETPELAEAVYAHGGVDFATEAVDMHPSFESLVVISIAFITGVFSIRVPPEALALAFLDKVLAAMEIHHDTCDYNLFSWFCNVLCVSFTNGCDMPVHAYASVVRFLLHGITKHRDDEEAQFTGRKLLRAFLGPQMGPTDD